MFFASLLAVLFVSRLVQALVTPFRIISRPASVPREVRTSLIVGTRRWFWVRVSVIIMYMHICIFAVQVETKKTYTKTYKKKRKKQKNTYLTSNQIIKQLTNNVNRMLTSAKLIIVATLNYTCQVAYAIINDK